MAVAAIKASGETHRGLASNSAGPLGNWAINDELTKGGKQDPHHIAG